MGTCSFFRRTLPTPYPSLCNPFPLQHFVFSTCCVPYNAEWLQSVPATLETVKLEFHLQRKPSTLAVNSVRSLSLSRKENKNTLVPAVDSNNILSLAGLPPGPPSVRCVEQAPLRNLFSLLRLRVVKCPSNVLLYSHYFYTLYIIDFWLSLE